MGSEESGESRMPRVSAWTPWEDMELSLPCGRLGRDRGGEARSSASGMCSWSWWGRQSPDTGLQGRVRLAAGYLALRVDPHQGPAGRWTPSTRPFVMAPPWH